MLGMGNRNIVIIGGGLAGLSAGCYALKNDYQTTIVEHNAALGGVCTAWARPPYVIDGCIHWLTGGPYQRYYEELGILPSVGLRVLQHWTTYKDVRDGFECAIRADLDELVRELVDFAPQDWRELERVRAAAREVGEAPALRDPDLTSTRDNLRAVWEMRSLASTFLHFRKPLGLWTREHLRSPRLQRLFSQVLPPDVPALFMLMVLGYLERGYLSRPVGGTAAFRDALTHSYRARGGEVRLHATVDEILTTGDRVRGVRLSDGTELESELVISTSSAPETVLRLLGGRYEGEATRERLAQWRLIEPIVMASFGVAQPYADAPGMLTLDHIDPFEVGGRAIESLYVRVCNDDASYAPPGHAVVQAMASTDYDWWAMRGTSYHAAKEAIADALLGKLEPHFPAIRSAVRVTDVATPLTFWRSTRAWRGAYEGWIPDREHLYTHIHKKLKGLSGLYMAGQWVEPGGGVPTAIASGRHVVEMLCRDAEDPFIPA
jgi:phytoene desaturase